MTTPRERSGAMTSEEVESLVQSMMEEASTFVEEELQPIRDKSTDYYMGRPFGNEEDGRSKVVDTVLRDTVQAQLPSLMRVFWGPEKVVEFRPRTEEDVPKAEQATDYINFVVREDNDGFLQIYSGFKDALVRKTGIFKWWWEDMTTITSYEYSGMSEDELLGLQEDEDNEVEITGVQPLDGVMTEDGIPAMLFDCKVTRTEKDGRARFAAVPPEEVGWNRTARSIDDARIFYHKREIMLSDAVGMGYDLDDIEHLAGRTDATLDEAQQSRRFDEGDSPAEEDQDPHTRPFLYTEAYVYLDMEGEGLASLYKICMGGDAYEVIKEAERCDERPFGILVADPEPHTIIGLDDFDYTGDLQLINSAILRGTLDSLSLALVPRTEIVENMVNLGDAMKTEVGGLVRVRQPGMMREIKHTFVGADSLPMLEYMDSKKETRTGQTKAAMGLDADSLQSSTRAAVAATLSASQQRLEMLARCFAETGIKQLYKGLLRLVTKHQDKERMVRLRNTWAPIDPSVWEPNMDVSVNVALGAGMTEDKLATLAQIAAKQEQALQLLGPDNPLVSPRQLRNTYARMVELSGYKDASEFFKEITEEDEKRAAEAAAQQKEQPPQDPGMALVQVEAQKAQAKAQVDQQELQLKMQESDLKRQEIMLRDDRERDKNAAEMTLKMHQLELEHQAKLNKQQLDADFQAERLRQAAPTGGE